MPTVSVVIVNYNGLHFLSELFASLARQTLPADQVMLVDNASSDGSVEFTRKNFPWVTVLPQSVNLGFAEGNNVGVAHSRGEYIALLNSDTVVDDHWLAELVRALELDKHAGIAVSKIFLGSTHRVIDCAGAEFNNLGFCWGRGANQLDRGQFDNVGEVAAATACALLLRRQALDGEPAFDRSLFMYYEEFELSLRVRARNYGIVYVPSSVVHHKRTQSVKQASRKPHLFTQYYGNRNRVKILAKYYPFTALLPSLPLIIMSLVYWNAVFLLQGSPALCAQAVAAQFRYAVQGLRERRRGRSSEVEPWLRWMHWQGLREILALKGELGSYGA